MGCCSAVKYYIVPLLILDSFRQLRTASSQAAPAGSIVPVHVLRWANRLTLAIAPCCRMCCLSVLLRVQWEGRHFKLTAVYAPGEPGFSVYMTFRHEDDYGPHVRQVSMCWPPEVTAAVVPALDDVLGLRPMAARGT
jgi:hypothetical protein